MELSRFVLTYKDVRAGEHILYSVMEDRYLGVDDATLAAVERWTKQRNSPCGVAEQQAQQVLIEEGFLVEGRAADDERLRVHLDKAREGVPGAMFVTLMPTLACNLACTYCFQRDHPGVARMPPPVEDATLEWILRRVDERALGHLNIHYFGGEPLTRKGFCLRTAEVLSASMAARGGTFSWQMTTNGIGLDVDFATAMRKFGDGVFKVTLDGDKETHDQMRVWRSGRGTFDEIFANVLAVAPHARVRIGGNFLPDQAASFEKLLDRLETSGVPLDSVHFKPIVDTQHREQGTCTSCSDKAETQTFVQLGKSTDRRKLPTRAQAAPESLESMLGPCELHWKNNYTIDPEGRVYKCPAVAGLPGLEVATVTAEAAEKVAPLLALRPWEQCGDCAFLPVCVGGCLGGKFLQTGRTDQVSCKKDLFEQSFRESTTQRFLAEFPEGEALNHAA